VARTGPIHWCTFDAALDELGWPWLRLHADLVAGRLFYRTYPPGYEIDWNDPNLRIDRAESTVTIATELPIEKTFRIITMGFSCITVAVEVLLPVGQRPLVDATPRPWQPKLSREKIEAAVKNIAQAHPPPDWLPFPDFWAKLKAQLGPEVTKRVATDALKLAPHLRGKRGQTRKMKSSS
jgi:hypothetical protein